MTPPKTLINANNLTNFAYNKRTGVLRNTALKFSFESIANTPLFSAQQNVSNKVIKNRIQSPTFQTSEKNENKQRECTVNQTVVNYYENELEQNSKQIKKLEQKSDKYYKQSREAFDALLKFEEEHSNVSWIGIKNEKDAPKNAKIIDISMFGVGVPNDKEKAFTGEICQLGYIVGLENLSPKEQKEFEKLLKTAQKTMKKCRDYDESFNTLYKQTEKYSALQDTAKAGMLNTIGSQEYEETVYNEWVNVRNECNSFYKEIQELEQKRNKLWLKYERTKEDEILIEQYETQIRQLTEASQAWSISQSGRTINNNSNNNSLNAYTNVSSDIIGENYQAGVGIKENNSGSISYSNSNISVNAGITTCQNNIVKQSFAQNADETTPSSGKVTQTSQKSADLSLGVQYARGRHFVVNSNSSYSFSKNSDVLNELNSNDSKTYTQNINVRAYNFNTNITGNVSSSADYSSTLITGSTDYTAGPFKFEVNGTYQSMLMNQNDDQSMNMHTQNYKYGLKTSANIGKHLTSSISVESADISLLKNAETSQPNIAENNNNKFSYEASLAGNYMTNKNGLTLQCDPQLTFKHNSMGDINSVMFNVTGGVNYNNKNYSAGVSLTGSYFNTLGKNNTSNQYSYSTTISANAGYKNVTLTGNLTSMSSNTSENLRYGVNVKWENDILGLSAGYTNGNFEDTPGPEMPATAQTDRMFYTTATFKFSNYTNPEKRKLQEIKADTQQNLSETELAQYIFYVLKEQLIFNSEISDKDILEQIKEANNPDLPADKRLEQIIDSLKEKNIIQNIVN